MEEVPKVGQKKPHVVFIPLPAQSHIKCMLKLARLLHHKGLLVTFINTQSNQKRLVTSGGTSWLDDAPGFQFLTVPDGLASTSDSIDEPLQSMEQVARYLADNFLDSFLDLVAGLNTPVTCIVSDGFMTFAKTRYAGEKLRVPIILHWTFAACGFIGFYQAKVLMEKGVVPLKDESYLTNGYLDTLVDIPGMNGIRLRDLPEHILGVGPKAHALKFMLLLNQIRAKGSNNSNFSGYSLWKEEPECLQWLQSKEPNSVVYVNFGSLAVMSLQDLVEFGWGLVNSNSYFLWIIRDNLIDGKPAVLPPELEEVIKSKGFIATWCSQEEVLNHHSVGGFLTHGGWGSVIESLSAGVPMICCPFSGDQRTNCAQMCKEWEVGMEIGRNVKRDEVEKLVRELMDGVEGVKMRKKAIECKKIADISTKPKGSSSIDIEELVAEIRMISRN
ncbi:putative UDP-glucuronosyl/UDP-glucosyltransferase, UDP-glycosyltransferase family [Helianthus annuus]|uniref:Glycosyltransferase n=1 Tax=Helianthus annuus TaxID=4232 RepID=A0A9K3J5I7_HELAN|nr:UDP-glycosyltransferase 85C1 isoform X2 [Helianthus annuus]KAF5808786.1 putative UDP-glucuronosyl/UDP-glucosyltransferase, UDP-glycosyltransferase family [Helianthus annuus]KAJ0595784.1 putative UDP-glucuronosyl/UDP-glucosyltransferase, UDP-glycosyltransferase family [Helianthus annuus]KAJ0756442.1 putative UDP-glucuronosyl/UDP-glucosyltransferase, UDP-glycosyltransferase family [Helianthus annuus]KAJ0929968.1 putative UDP-glucuronosyl/UDP-glucosyltransferase, UDP-glycosyltransferase family 